MDPTELGFRFGTLTYRCEACGYTVEIVGYPFLAISGTLSLFFLLRVLPKMIIQYPEFWQATFHTALVLLNICLILRFLKLLYENIACRGIEPWSRVVMAGLMSGALLATSGSFVLQSYNGAFFGFSIMITTVGALTFWFLRGVAALISCPAREGWSFQWADLVRILVIAVIFWIAAAFGDSKIISTFIQ